MTTWGQSAGWQSNYWFAASWFGPAQESGGNRGGWIWYRKRRDDEKPVLPNGVPVNKVASVDKPVVLTYTSVEVLRQTVNQKKLIRRLREDEELLLFF